MAAKRPSEPPTCREAICATASLHIGRGDRAFRVPGSAVPAAQWARFEVGVSATSLERLDSEPRPDCNDIALAATARPARRNVVDRTEQSDRGLVLRREGGRGERMRCDRAVPQPRGRESPAPNRGAPRATRSAMRSLSGSAGETSEQDPPCCPTQPPPRLPSGYPTSMDHTLFRNRRRRFLSACRRQSVGIRDEVVTDSPRDAEIQSPGQAANP